MIKKKCRMCGGAKFEEVVDFGLNPIVNSLLEESDLKKKEKVYPLIVDQCQTCFLVQTRKPLKSEKIYSDQDYLYFSSDMPKLSEYFLEYEKEVAEKFLHGSEDLVVEIGSNDGIFLKHFKNDGYRVLGVDPASNVVLRALHDGIPTLSSFFDLRVAKNIFKHWGKAKVITANNCIAHLDNLDDVMEGVKLILADDGVMVIECNYWGGMVKNKNYALIYHDHFSYFSLQNWVDYVKKFGMEVFDATVTEAQGGSLRVFFGWEVKQSQTSRFITLKKEEEDTNLNSRATTIKYKADVLAEAEKLHDIIQFKRSNNKHIAGYGAAAKGFSVLKLARIDQSHIDYFVDDSPAKQGKYTPVTHIPIVSRQSLTKLPDYFFLTAPNYEKIIIEKEQQFLANGGHFITVDGREI